MRRTRHRRSAALAAVVVAALLTASCGSVEITRDDEGQTAPTDDETPSATPAPEADTSAGEGDWLLGLQSAGGADGETSTTVYVTYNPSTGAAQATSLPGVQAASASAQQAALLVSGDRQWAIPDTGISRAGETSGRLKVYSLATGKATVLDLRERSGTDDLKPIAWAFDPERADTLRVVDTANRIWAVNVAGGKAVQEGSLPKGPWVFTNGFNFNTGEPWVESIDSDATNPPGNGPSDTSPVRRAGGTVLPAGSDAMTELPASPCRLGAGFTDESGVSWAFCADKPALTTYYLPQGSETWTPYGKPSEPVGPVAASFPLVLPPAA